MKQPALAKVAWLGVLLLSGHCAHAHRLDEYLQATTISLEKDRVLLQLRLTPGVAVLPLVLAMLDPNDDGIISSKEQEAYVDRVLQDVSLSIDDAGSPRRMTLISSEFPKIETIREGLGQIRLDFEANVPPSVAANRTIAFENRHQKAISAYLVNCLIPRDPDLKITSQNRNYEQSSYRLQYTQRGISSNGRALVALLVVLLLARLAVELRQQRAAANESG